MPAPSLFEKHLFLSYAHRDNEPLVEGHRGWIEQFQHVLKVRLGQIMGGEPKIWWDRAALKGNDLFAGGIETGLVRSAILVPIVSPSYNTSDWCQRELEAFCAAAQQVGGVRIGTQSRIFKVVKWPIARNDEPNQLQGLLGYEFYRTDAATGRVREFHSQDIRIDPEYVQRVDDLAEDIRRLLQSMLEEQPAPDPLATRDVPTLYVAETTSDLSAERDRILRTLRQRGYAVVPAEPLPLSDGARLRGIVDLSLARVRLSIHLVGAHYGAIPENETHSAVVIQNELAAARSADPGFRRLIWMPRGLVPVDDRQRAFLECLRTDSSAQRGADILPATIDDLESAIEDLLHPPGKPDVASAFEPAAGAALKYVYLLCDRRDLQAAEALRDFLYDCDARLEVTLPLFDGDEADITALHRESLTRCDGALVFVGEAPESWLRTKLMELQKAAGYGRQQPMAAKGIWMTSPPASFKERFRTREAIVIKGDRPSLESLTPFLDGLGKVSQ